MKLLSCYIANFGKYSDYDMDFADGITSILLKNGEGKTTFAAFLRAMLYGLDSVKGKEFADRLHYYPFAGGQFGGNLVFRHGGQEYRVERFFDKKSDTKDEARLYIDGKESPMPKPSLGEALLSIDAAGFAATLFFSDGTKYDYTSVKRRLIPGDEAAIVDYPAAVAALDDKLRALKAFRGNGGLIHDEAEKIASLEGKLKAREEIEKLLAKQKEECRELSARKKTLEEEENLLRSRETLKARYETLRRYAEDAEREGERFAAWKEKFPKGVPSAEVLNRLQENEDEMRRNRTRLETADFPGAKRERLSFLESKFEKGIPTDEAMTSLRENIRRVRNLSEQTRPTDGQDEDYAALRDRFGNRAPDADGIRAGMEKYRSAERNMTAKQPNKAVNKDIIAIGSLVAGILLCLIGIVLIAVNAAAFGFGMAVIGLASLGFGGFRFLSRRVDRPADTTELQNAERELYAKLMPFGYYSDSPLLDAQKCLDDFSRFCSVTERRKADAAARENTAAETDQLTKEIDAFFALYRQQEEDFDAKYQSLSQQIAAFDSLKKEAEEQGKCKQLYANKLLKLENERKTLLSPFGFSEEISAARLSEDCKSYEMAKTHFEEAVSRQEAYQKEEKLDSVPDIDVSKLPEVRTELSMLNEKIQAILLQIENNESRLEIYADIANDLQRAKENLAELEKKHSLLTYTKAYLADAEMRLNRRFIGPIYDAFSSYLKEIGTLFDFSFSVDQDFQVSFEDGGVKHSSAHLSAGQSVAVNLCLRLALADAVFSGEKPPMIFDDPFSALDANNFISVSKILRQICTDRQILYFTCHDSRML